MTITLDGPPPMGTADEVVISVVTATETIPIANCGWRASDAGTPQLRCESEQRHSGGGSSIRFHDTDMTTVRVTITDGATTIADQTFRPEYASREINGPGCGVCTSATIVVNAY